MVPLALLGAAGLVLLLTQRGVRLSNWLIARGHARASRFVLHFVDVSPVKTLTLLTCDLVEGKTHAGLARVEGLLALVPQVPDQWRLLLINSLSNVLINAGKYREALALRRVVRKAMREAHSSEASGLIIVNAVEALYNLGRWRAAKRICGAALEQNGYSGLALEGLRVQLAWVHARTGRPDDAAALLALTSDSRFPVLYRSEVHFTHAAVALARSDFEAALRSVEHGVRLAKRASSKRNGAFLRGEILYARGDTGAAESAFRLGAQSVYRAQGGHSLALWADCLAALGRHDEASGVLKLVVERDPQSDAAANCTTRRTRTRSVFAPEQHALLPDAAVS